MRISDWSSDVCSSDLDEDDPFSFEDETTRTRTLRLGATHQSGRDTVGLAAFAGTNEDGSEGDEEFYQASLNWGLPLTPAAGFTSRASYSHSDFETEDSTDEEYRQSAGVHQPTSPENPSTPAY